MEVYVSKLCDVIREVTYVGKRVINRGSSEMSYFSGEQL